MNATLTTTKATTEVHQSKWGYHPVDRDGFLKLKEAHQLLLRAYRDIKRYRRWENKDPQNRHGDAPKYPEFLMEYGHHFIDNGGDREDWRSFYGYGFKRYWSTYGATSYYFHILRQYRQARMPVSTPEEVKPLELPNDLDQIVEKLREFYA